MHFVSTLIHKSTNMMLNSCFVIEEKRLKYYYNFSYFLKYYARTCPLPRNINKCIGHWVTFCNNLVLRRGDKYENRIFRKKYMYINDTVKQQKLKIINNSNSFNNSVYTSACYFRTNFVKYEEYRFTYFLLSLISQNYKKMLNSYFVLEKKDWRCIIICSFFCRIMHYCFPFQKI